MIRSVPIALAAILLSACGAGGEPEDSVPQRDPQVAQALDDPLLTDPDLSTLNEAGAALTVITDRSLPLLPPTREAIEAAREEAASLVGGSDNLFPLGEPSATANALPLTAAPDEQLAVAGGSGACGASLQRGAIWAARMPVEMPIYPRAGLTAASGSQSAGCDVRVLTFVTPVDLPDVLAFYSDRARRAGPKPIYARAGVDLLLRGASAALAYEVRARRVGDQTVVRMVTMGR